MKEILVFSVPCYRPDKRKYASLVVLEKKVLREDLSSLDNDKRYIYKVYELPDNTIFFDEGHRGLIFKTLADIQSFLIANDGAIRFETDRYKHFKGKENFSLEILDYVEAFETRYGVRFNFTNINTIKELDTLLTTGKVVIDNEYLAIIAIIGSFFSANIPNARWQNFYHSDSDFYPVIAINEQVLSPVKILEQTRIYIRKGYKLLLFRPIAFSIRKMLDI